MLGCIKLEAVADHFANGDEAISSNLIPCNYWPSIHIKCSDLLGVLASLREYGIAARMKLQYWSWARKLRLSYCS